MNDLKLLPIVLTGKQFCLPFKPFFFVQYKPYPSPGQGTLSFLRRLQFDFSNLVIWNAVAGCLPPLLHTPFYLAHWCAIFLTTLYSPCSVTPLAEFGCKVLRRCWWLADQTTFMIAILVSVAVKIIDRICVNLQVTLKSGFWWIRKLGIIILKLWPHNFGCHFPCPSRLSQVWLLVD